MQHEYRLIIRVPRLLDTNKKEEKEGLVETPIRCCVLQQSAVLDTGAKVCLIFVIFPA